MKSISIWGDLLTVPFRVSYVEANGLRTRVLDAGMGSTLFLLHGTGGHLEVYAKNIQGLARSFRVIAYDLLGHGFTDKPDRPYTIDVYIDHLIHLMGELGVEKAHFCGMSLGALVAAWFAKRFPERVDRLVLMNPGNVTANVDTMARIREMSLKAVQDANMQTVRRRLEAVVLDKSNVTEELVAIRLAIYNQPGFYRAMENILVLQDVDVRKREGWNEEWCKNIAAPTLIAQCELDVSGTLQDAHLLAGWIPDSTVEIVSGRGHWIQWEDPDAFNELVSRFLTQ